MFHISISSESSFFSHQYFYICRGARNLWLYVWWLLCSPGSLHHNLSWICSGTGIPRTSESWESSHSVRSAITWSPSLHPGLISLSQSDVRVPVAPLCSNPSAHAALSLAGRAETGLLDCQHSWWYNIYRVSLSPTGHHISIPADLQISIWQTVGPAVEPELPHWPCFVTQPSSGALEHCPNYLLLKN